MTQTLDKQLAKLTRERDNARRDRDNVAEKFKDFKADKLIIDKALWLLAHEFVVALTQPGSLPLVEKPKDQKGFMTLMESVVARVLLAAKDDEHEWVQSDERVTLHSRTKFMPPISKNENMH